MVFKHWCFKRMYGSITGMLLIALMSCGALAQNTPKAWDEQLRLVQNFVKTQENGLTIASIGTLLTFTDQGLAKIKLPVVVEFVDQDLNTLDIRYETHDPENTFEEFSRGSGGAVSIPEGIMAQVKLGPDEVLKMTWDTGIAYQQQFPGEKSYLNHVTLDLIHQQSQLPPSIKGLVVWRARYEVTRQANPNPTLDIWVDAQSGEILGRTEPQR